MVISETKQCYITYVNVVVVYGLHSKLFVSSSSGSKRYTGLTHECFARAFQLLNKLYLFWMRPDQETLVWSVFFLSLVFILQRKFEEKKIMYFTSTHCLLVDRNPGKGLWKLFLEMSGVC